MSSRELVADRLRLLVEQPKNDFFTVTPSYSKTINTKMLRPWLGLVVIAFAFVVIAFEVIVLAVYYTFLGLEVIGLLLALIAIANGITGILTGKEDLPFQTRQGIFLMDFILSVFSALFAFGMFLGSLFAMLVYLYIVMLLGSTGILEIMAFFGIPVVPLFSLIVLKGIAMVVYFVILVASVVAAVSNRRNTPR